MKTYTVLIQETNSFEVEAESMDDAHHKALDLIDKDDHKTTHIIDIIPNPTKT